jgi:hypothetical protein
LLTGCSSHTLATIIAISSFGTIRWWCWRFRFVTVIVIFIGVILTVTPTCAGIKTFAPVIAGIARFRWTVAITFTGVVTHAKYIANETRRRCNDYIREFSSINTVTILIILAIILPTTIPTGKCLCRS